MTFLRLSSPLTTTTHLARHAAGRHGYPADVTEKTFMTSHPVARATRERSQPEYAYAERQGWHGVFCGDYYSATSVFVVGGGVSSRSLPFYSLALSLFCLNEERHFASAQRSVRFLRHDAAVTAAYLPFCRGWWNAKRDKTEARRTAGRGQSDYSRSTVDTSWKSDAFALNTTSFYRPLVK